MWFGGRQVTNDELGRWLHDNKEAKKRVQGKKGMMRRLGSDRVVRKPSKAKQSKPPTRSRAAATTMPSRPGVRWRLMRHWWRRPECDRRSPGIPAQVLSAAPPLLSHGGRRGLLVVVPALTSCPSVASGHGQRPFLFLFAIGSGGMAVWVGYECGRAGTARPVVSSFILFKKSTPTKKRNEREWKKESTLILVLFALVLGLVWFESLKISFFILVLCSL
jgi:hypothetical protein